MNVLTHHVIETWCHRFRCQCTRAPRSFKSAQTSPVTPLTHRRNRKKNPNRFYFHILSTLIGILLMMYKSARVKSTQNLCFFPWPIWSTVGLARHHHVWRRNFSWQLFIMFFRPKSSSSSSQSNIVVPRNNLFCCKIGAQYLNKKTRLKNVAYLDIFSTPNGKTIITRLMISIDVDYMLNYTV